MGNESGTPSIPPRLASGLERLGLFVGRSAGRFVRGYRAGRRGVDVQSADGGYRLTKFGVAVGYVVFGFLTGYHIWKGDAE